MEIKQLSVFLENRPGQLATITSILAEENIDLKAISVAETNDYGVFRMITDDSSRSEKVLKENGYVVAISPVVAVEVPNRPGGLSNILRIISENNVDIEYMYSVFPNVHGGAYMVFKAKEEGQIRKVLLENGITPAEAEELGIGE